VTIADAWAELAPPWRASFELAWDAYAVDSIPVGAVVVDADGSIVSRGRNRIFDAQAPPGELANTWLAHAEVNALAALPPARFPEHVLYTAMEPCALCYGAALMSTVGTVRFAAPDPIGAASRWAGQIVHRTRTLALEGPLEGPFGRLAPLLVVENITRRVPDSATAAVLRGERSDLLARADELRARGVHELAHGGASLDEGLRALWDLIE
jgi:tRNA(Arg) A34 adenosine deaminase TadA